MTVKPVQEGAPAPDFILESTEGGKVALSAFRGRPVVLYFYPKDDTPGCTKEACSFRDASAALKGSGAVVLGVSKDALKNHLKFRDKYALNFPLLADPDMEAIRAYGLLKEKNMYGKKVMGVERSTFLIGPDGMVQRAWRGVKVDGHAEEVLEALKNL